MTPESYRNQSAQRLLTALELPVTAFTDYDPDGLAIAAKLPFFSCYLMIATSTPPETFLRSGMSAQLWGRMSIIKTLFGCIALSEQQEKRYLKRN